MGNILLGAGIAIGLFMVFVFWASGSVFSYIFKLKSNNIFINIGIGFFVYFSVLSFLLFPFEMISLLPYGYFLYITNIFTILYSLITFLFFKFWITRKIISFDSLWFIFTFFCCIGLNIVTFKYLLTSNYTLFKNSISILYWLNDIQISFFGDTLSGQLAFQNIQSWYTFQLSWVTLLNLQSMFTSSRQEIFQDYLFVINIIIEGAICASLIAMVNSFLMKNNNTVSKNINMFISLTLVLAFKIMLIYLSIDLFTSQIYYIYLFLFVIILMINYVSSKYKAKNEQLLIGIILSSYIAFSWSLSYEILFLVFSFIFIMQMWFKYRFTKDLYKISILFILDFVLYNIIEKLYLLSIIYICILILFSTIMYLMNRNYNIAISFETLLNNNERISIMIVPIFLIGTSIFIGLANNEDITTFATINIEEYSTIFNILNYKSRLWISITATLSLMLFSLIWLLKTFSLKSSKTKSLVDLMSINYLTFYNPMSIRTLRYIVFNKMEFSNGNVLLLMLFIVLITFISKIEEKTYGKIKNKNKIMYNNITVLYK